MPNVKVLFKILVTVFYSQKPSSFKYSQSTTQTPSINCSFNFHLSNVFDLSRRKLINFYLALRMQRSVYAARIILT